MAHTRIALALSLVLGACAAPPQKPAPVEVREVFSTDIKSETRVDQSGNKATLITGPCQPGDKQARYMLMWTEGKLGTFMHIDCQGNMQESVKKIKPEKNVDTPFLKKP